MEPLKVGDEAPDFVVNEATGQTLHELIHQNQSPALVYFYPAAFSPACTAQACMIRNLQKACHTDGSAIIGINPQGAGLNRVFQHMMHLPQQLVLDKTRVIGDMYGVVGPFGFYRRLSFIVGIDLKVHMRARGGLSLTTHRDLFRHYFELSNRTKQNGIGGGAKPE